MIPTTCQSPAACNGRPIARFGKTWLCRACLDYTNQHNCLPTEPSMSETEQQIIDYLRANDRSHTSAIAAALDLNPNTVAGTLSRLRRAGIVAPSTGDGCAALVDAPPADPAPTAAPTEPAPALDPDVVQTSDVDILRAENARLAEENTRLDQAAAAFEQVLMGYGLSGDPDRLSERLYQIQESGTRLERLMSALVTARVNPVPEGIASWADHMAEIEAENGRLAREVDESLELIARLDPAYSECRADNARLRQEINDLKVQIVNSPATIEWTPWNEDEGEISPSTRLTIRIGGFSSYIAKIVSNHGFKATVYYSDTQDTLAVVTGATLAAVMRPLMALLTDAGVAAPPIPEPA